MVSLQVALLALAVSGPGPESGETVLLDFYADWCGPCRQMDATVQQLAAKGYPVRKVNFDRNRDLVAKYRIGPIPCFIMLVNGREVARHVGGTSLGRLESMCRMGTAARSTGSLAGGGAARGAKVSGGIQIPAVQLGSPKAPLSVPAEETRPETTVADRTGTPSRWRLASTTQSPRPGTAVKSDAELIACSVRLRIKESNGYSCGSGTIIDARGGQALILTCGHVFRNSRGKGEIEVELFGPNGVRKVRGYLESWNDERDVGLLRIRVDGPVAVARVAPPSYQVRKGDPVVSVGCNRGADPTARHSRVVSLNRYSGPPNLQIDDQPVLGRSGGGLFTRDGLVIGVCNAADPEDREGFFAALAAIHDQLDDTRLSFIYRADQSPSMLAQTPEPARAVTAPLSRIPQGPIAGRPAAGLRPEEQAALEEIRRRKAEGAEVICIIRPLHDPAAKSEILVLNRASPALLEALAGEAANDSLRRTSLAVPRLRPLFRLDAER